MTLRPHLPLTLASPRVTACWYSSKITLASHQVVIVALPLRLLKLISSKLSCIASVYCFRHVDRKTCIGRDKLGSRYTHSVLCKGKYFPHVDWTSGWGVRPYPCPAHVFPGMKAFLKGYQSSFTGNIAQCCFVHIDRRTVEMKNDQRSTMSGRDVKNYRLT